MEPGNLRRHHKNKKKGSSVKSEKLSEPSLFVKFSEKLNPH